MIRVIVTAYEIDENAVDPKSMARAIQNCDHFVFDFDDHTQYGYVIMECVNAAYAVQTVSDQIQIP